MSLLNQEWLIYLKRGMRLMRFLWALPFNSFRHAYGVPPPSMREAGKRNTEGLSVRMTEGVGLIYFNLALLRAVTSWLKATQIKITPSIRVESALISGVPPERRPV